MKARKDKNRGVEINLNSNESLVFFNWLSNFNDNENAGSYFTVPVEENLLYDLEAVLEKILVETFQDNYIELLDKAKKNVIKNR